MKYQDSTGQVNDLVSGTPDSLLCLDNGNQTISSGYESSECGSTTTNSKVQSKNVIEIECNHNTVLTEENLTRFMQQVEQIRLDSGSDQLSESYSNSLIEIKNHSLRSSSDSDKLSFGTVSDLTYSDDDEGLSSTSCELPLSPGSHLYPHGIINPNYPGFQHLAHTLSEDYSTHASNCNLSDCGMYQNRNSTSDDNGNVQETENSPPSPISDSIISSTKDFNNYDHKNLLEQCNLQTYLNHYRNKSDVKMFEEEFEKSNLTPPDILFFKGCDNETQKESVITDEKPDLIQNVYQQENYMSVKLNEFNHDDDDDFMCDEIPNNSLTSNIVGDFEKEIEKEIVEIVSGYKDIFGDRTSGNYQKPHTTTPVKDEITQINHQPISAYNKIHDAKLSNGREALTPNFEMKPIKMPVPMMVKRAEVKQLTMTTHNMNKSEIQSNLNNNNNDYYYNTTLNGTLMQHNRAVNHTINYNNNVYSNLQQQQQQPNKEKHHYNCNFFNALSTRKQDTRNTKTSFLSSNSTGKTIIKTKDECGIISIEAPSSIFDFSVIEKKLNSVIREKDEKVIKEN
uniref:CSON003760 protein n=1 Tax=Culicoides sonorensis TaxID=179676 RepID=A0A336L2B5_CULSO